MPASVSPFEALQDMVYVLNHFDASIDPYTIIAPTSGKSDSRYRKGYQLLKEKKCDDEALFAQSLGFPDAKDKSYRRYRSELVYRFQQVHLFVNIGNGDENDYLQNSIEIAQKWSIARRLRLSGVWSAFFYAATECLDLAEKFEMSTIAIEVLFSLTSAALSRPELSKDFQIWQEALVRHKSAYDATFQVILIRESFTVACVGRKGHQKDLAALAIEAFDKVEGFLESHPQFSVQVHTRLLKIVRHEILLEWKEMSKAAKDALDFFAQKPYSIGGLTTTFSIYLIIASAMDGQHDEARTIADKYLVYTKEGTFYWFKNREIICCNAFYASDYRAAYDIVQLAIKQERFKHLPAIDQETWRLYQGYLLWLFKCGYLALSEAEQQDMKRLRISAIMNDMPIYTKDKQGGNIPLTILQTLFLMADGKWDDFELRADALRKYRERNLNAGEDQTRSDTFIRMIGLIGKHYNNIPELKKKVEPLLEEFKDPQKPTLGPSYEVEPLKYEKIWVISLEILYNL